MPHIEELPTTARAAAPGWSYVVDTGYDPSKAAINPSSRKRVRASVAGLSQGDLTIRQQTAIQRHLDDLDKDSHKPVNIAPPKSKLNRRQTQNTRRILASGKDFSHYLDQDEAALASKQHTGMEVDMEPPKAPQRASKTPIARRKLQAQAQAQAQPAVSAAVEQSPAPTAALANAASTVPSAPLIPSFLKPYLVDSSVDSHQLQHDSLLSPPAPLTATTAEIEALLSAPQLSYNAARSAPSPATAPPQRVFCEMCGYWGRVKCLKCGSRVCGLECKSAHEESRCIRF
jgi:zinc finger HIT domain-containing protein 1